MPLPLPIRVLTAYTAFGGRRRLGAASALVVAAALVGPIGSISADTGARYVATWGSDSNAGTSSAPWRTVSRGFSAISAGQTLWIRGGTYAENFSGSLHDGTVSARVTVRSYPGERAVIAGLIRFNDPDYWTIADLSFTWGDGTFDDHMVKVSGGTGWTLEGLDIYGSQSRAGLLVARSATHGAPHDYILRRSVIRDSARASNLYLNPGLDATNGLVERNLFFNSPTENAKIGWGGSDIASHLDEFGAASIVFRYNTLYNAAQPLTIAEPARNVDAYGNLIVRGSKGYLIRLDGVEGHLGTGIRIHDNLGTEASRWCEAFEATPSCATASIGNTFPHDPRFDSRTATSFHPQDVAAMAYGRWAVPVAGRPVEQIRTGTLLANNVPVAERWASAPLAATYHLQYSINGGAWRTLASGLKTTRWTGVLSVGTRYRMRVRGVSTTGVAGPWVAGTTFIPVRYQDGTSAAKYEGTWRIRTDRRFSGGRVHVSGTRGSTATFRFTGRAVGLVGTLGPTRGKFAVHVDGNYVRTIDTARASFRAQQILYTKSWASGGTHSLTIRVLGTGGRPRVDIDAFVVLR